MKLAPEGLPFVACGVAVLLALLVGAWLGGSSWWMPLGLWTPVAFWVPWFFRNPDRDGPRGPELVIAPADGKVVGVVEVSEPDYLCDRAVRVSIFMNVFNVHVNRHPIDGAVEHRDYRPGKFFNATLDKASQYNEQMSLGIRGPRGAILVRQIAGLIARRIVTDPAIGDAVHQGGRLGLIRFGSRVDTFVPVDTRVEVQVGDRTAAGSTVLARWPQ
jgi:phosphatidylserine decarboxylase